MEMTVLKTTLLISCILNIYIFDTAENVVIYTVYFLDLECHISNSKTQGSYYSKGFQAFSRFFSKVEIKHFPG